MMTRDPVSTFPVSFNPFSVSVVVPVNPDLSTMRAGAHIDGCEGGQKPQTNSKNQQFHFQLIIPF
jgi:hypothetical protein